MSFRISSWPYIDKRVPMTFLVTSPIPNILPEFVTRTHLHTHWFKISRLKSAKLLAIFSPQNANKAKKIAQMIGQNSYRVFYVKNKRSE